MENVTYWIGTVAWYLFLAIVVLVVFLIGLAFSIVVVMCGAGAFTFVVFAGDDPNGWVSRCMRRFDKRDECEERSPINEIKII